MSTEYDAAAALERIENELIDSMMRNLQRHLKEEETMGFDWSQWQTEQLRYLEEYRKKNAKKYGPQFASINRRIKHAITHARASGQKEEELRILEMMAKHPELKKTLRKAGATSIQGGSFFKINEGKLDALVKATTNDMTRAEHAVLRRCNDQYRKIIFDAQMYANTGAGTIQKALDMATHDFLMRGIDCIEYKNGARHTISDYADMAIRTAERRATLMGAGETRKAWGEELVIVNRRGTMRGGNFGHACPLCIPWLGKVLIDDVYSGGKPDGRHQLVSTAMQQGFLHPRCKDSFTTYFPGVTSEPEPVTKQELQEGAEQDKQEEERQCAERKAEQYGRLAKYQCDPGDRQKYKALEEHWETEAEKDETLIERRKQKLTEQREHEEVSEIDEGEIIDGLRRTIKSEIMDKKIISYNGLSESIRKRFENGLSNAEPMVKSLLQKVQSLVDYVESAGRSLYIPGFPGTIVINSKAPSGTMAHELFHYIDRKHDVSRHLQSCLTKDYNELRRLSNEDVKLYLMKQHPEAFKINPLSGKAVLLDEYRGISDLLNGLSKGNDLFGKGHAKSYWRKKGAIESEAWAQFGRIYFDNIPAVRELFTELFPTFEKDAIITLKELI